MTLMSLIIPLSLIISGAFGGIVCSFTASTETRLAWWQHSLIGICASLMIPLFLNTISSTLVADTLQNDVLDSGRLLVLIGFSLVASVSSLRFIRGLSDKFLKELDETKQKADAAESKASTALEIVERSEPSDLESEKRRELERDLSGTHKTILAHMCTGPYTMRSAAGLSTELGISVTEAHQALSFLNTKGLVESGQNSRGELRWYPSSAGRLVGMAATRQSDLPLSNA